VPEGKRVQAGIVDARNTMLEGLDDLRSVIEELASVVGAERLRVSPSAPIEFLPREKARAKLERLCEAARETGV
jgi:methionine synthase II (cobalamin-independent)